jgi:hypothetical protein
LVDGGIISSKTRIKGDHAWLTVDHVGISRVAGEKSTLEHVDAGYFKALRTRIRPGGFNVRFTIDPCVACAGIKKNGDDEEIQEALAYFLVIRSTC